jgi:hypothetical protein
MMEDMYLPSNSRIHLTRWAVTALAGIHRRSDHHLGLPGPRRPQPAGDANVSESCFHRASTMVHPEGENRCGSSLSA